MLVLLIIFLITIPVITKTSRRSAEGRQYPDADQAEEHHDRGGQEGNATGTTRPCQSRCAARLHQGGRGQEAAARIHIRADKDTRYEAIGPSCMRSSAVASRRSAF